MSAGTDGRTPQPTFWHAPELAKAGYPVFPVNGKEPTVEGGFYACTTDMSQIAEWIEDGHGDHDVAIPTGLPSGVVVIDADTPKTYAKMEEHYGKPTVLTRRGGHWWFRHPRNGKVTSNSVEDGLDRKGDGGLVAVPPSRGRAWTEGIPDLFGLPVLPREFWSTQPRENTDAPRHAPQDCKDAAVAAIAARVARIPQGKRHEHLRHLCGVLLARGVAVGDAEDVLIAAWTKTGGELAERAGKEVPNTLATTEQALAEGHATGVPRLEEITPGLFAELEGVFGWKSKIAFGRKEPHVHTEASRESWPRLDSAAFHGLAGDVARAVDPHCEADPVAVLANTLAAVGSAGGRGAFAKVGGDKHHLKLFVGLVGETAKGRKGMSWGPVRSLLEAVDPGWAGERVMGGLSSGEGLIHAVRDEVRGMRKDEEVVLDAGEPDKRLLVLEGELASILKVLGREGNTLSPVIRQAWDGDRLRTMTKNSPTKSTGAHVSIIAHVTKAELLIRRSKQLPFGGEWQMSDALIRRLDAAVRFARTPRVITWGASARAQWAEVYGPLSEGKLGLFGAVVGRAEAQALRLAILYAAMDESATIERAHLEAALALWDYAEESARYIFGDATGDPVADAILEALRNAGTDGLTRTEIRDLFKRHQSADRIDGALGELLRLGRVRRVTEQTGGRPAERWIAR